MHTIAVCPIGTTYREAQWFVNEMPAIVLLTYGFPQRTETYTTILLQRINFIGAVMKDSLRKGAIPAHMRDLVSN